MSAQRVRALALVAMVMTAAACADDVPLTAPEPQSLRLDSRIDCVGDVRASSVHCIAASPAELTASTPGSAIRSPVAGPVRDLILGNQGGYVKLASSNISVNNVTGVFSFDVTVKNLIAQAIGTTNGSVVAPTGIRVFFFSGPQMTSGTGTVDFVNPGGGFFYDGTGTFTQAGQPYYQYNTMLTTAQTSASRKWQIRFDPGVLTFAFQVYVSAPVQFPSGYITGNPYVLTLNPNQVTPSIGGTVRNAVGTIIGGAVTYDSDDPTVASVDASGAVTAGAANGITTVHLLSSVPEYVSTAVNVCASTPTITGGFSTTASIDSTACFSSFANAGRPDPSYRSDMFRISLTAGQQIDITMTSPDFHPYISLVDPLGVTEAFSTNTTTAHVLVGGGVLRTGIYIVEAGQDDQFASAGPGSYTLNVTTVP